MIYIDIDGTLTEDGNNGWGDPKLKEIQKVKDLIKEGKKIVIWSSRGLHYAMQFCTTYDLEPYVALRKPDVIIEDKIDRQLKKFRKISIDATKFLSTDL